MPKRSPTPPSRRLAGLLSLALLLGACNSGGAPATRSDGRGASTTRVPSADRSTTSAPSGERSADHPLLVAAGDIACVPGMAATPSQCQHEATAQLVEALDPDVVLPLGDLQYEYGEAANFAASYEPTWGRFKDRTRPVVGNHEYTGGRARGYFGYWGDAAHGPGGWYSFDVGAWHVVVLNSVCSVVGCGEGSEQLGWLRSDLAAAGKPCTLAAFHHPRFTSGLHGPDASLQPLWAELAAAGTDVALAGHDHHYERLATADGIRQFVVGTGGRNTYPVLGRAAGSEVVNTTTFGVLALTLRPDGYDWRFEAIPGSGSGFTDEGSASC